jgi:hypothetical protein
MSNLILNYAQPQQDQNRPILTRAERVVLALVGIFLPMLCFAASLNHYPGAPDYQAGRWFDYLALIPSPQASWPFAPFMFAPTFALAILVIAPGRAASSWLLRFALYSGSILSAQFTLIQAIAFSEPAAPLSLATIIGLGIAAVITLLALGALWLIRRLPHIKLAYWLPCVLLIPPAAVMEFHIALPIVLLTMLITALVAPALTLAAYLRISYLLWKLAPQPQSSAPQGKNLRIPLIWLITYASAWLLAFLNAIELYNSLPKTPPDC